MLHVQAHENHVFELKRIRGILDFSPPGVRIHESLGTLENRCEDTYRGYILAVREYPETSNCGADLEVVWVPADGWHMQLGVGFLDSEVDDATNLPTISKGNELPYNPSVSIGGLVRKEWQMAGGTLSLQTDLQYLDDQTYDIANKPEIAEHSFFEIGARAAYTFGPDERYSVAIWGKNLTGTDYCTAKLDIRGGLAETIFCTPYIGDPTYGVSARVNWN
jgi:iron complex outermembrane receptor protein